MHRFTFMGSPFDSATMYETLTFIEQRITKGEFIQHVGVNVSKLIDMQTDAALAQSVRECDFISVDGIGILLGARLYGHPIPERVAGVDLFHRLLDMSAKKGYPVFLLGAEPAVVEKTVQNVEKSYPGLKVAGFHHGYFWDEEAQIVDKISQSGAKLLFVAITSPQKELFINKWQHRLGVDFVMGVGGTFDVVAGKVKRAPLWMQNSGLEWLYRVIQEPGRMWKRYLVSNSKFAWLLLKNAFV